VRALSRLSRAELAAAAIILAVMAATILLCAQTLIGVTAARIASYRAFGAHMPDPVCYSPFCDYPDFWAAGILARAHSLATLYHPDAFHAWRQNLFSQGIPRLNWMYPPTTLLPSALVSFAPLLAGYFIWTIGLALLAAIILRRAGAAWLPIIGAILGPAANWSFLLGQIGILCGALFVAGMLNMQKRPRGGGVLLACLSIKPQFCFLLPVILLACRNRRALGATLIAGFAIFALTLACFGWQSWLLFFGPAREASSHQLNFPDLDAQIHGTSVLWALRNLHAAPAIAFAGQIIAATGAAVFAWRAWRLQGIDQAARVALTTCLLPLAVPYGYTDDLFGFSLAFLMLIRIDRTLESLCFTLLWLSPALMPLIYVARHVQAAPLFFLFGAVITWRRMLATPAARPA
jgi:hypothetical protein